MDNLYVHLHSDSSEAYHKDNRITNFRNQLATPLDIDANDYEVALVQCSYVYSEPYIKADTLIASAVVSPKITPRISYEKILADGKRTLEDTYYFMDDFPSDVDLLSYEKFFEGKNLTNKKTYMFAVGTDQHYKLQEFTDIFTYKPSLIQGDVWVVTIADIEEHLKEPVSNNRAVFNTILNYYLRPYGIGITENEVDKKSGRPEYVNLLSFSERLSHYYGSTKMSEFVEVPDVGEKMFTVNVMVSIQRIKKITPPEGLVLKDNDNITIYKDGEIHQTMKNYDFKSKNDVVNMSQLVYEINKHTAGLSVVIKHGSVYIKHTVPELKVKLSDEIENILGVNQTVKVGDSEKGVFKPFFAYGQQKMYIYCDIIKNQFIGDQMAPILRITNYKGKNNSTTIQEFSTLQYVPLKNVVIDQIHMYIRSETSGFLPIEHGAFTATLHFRKKKF